VQGAKRAVFVIPKRRFTTLQCAQNAALSRVEAQMVRLPRCSSLIWKHLIALLALACAPFLAATHA
jgi:hypothetical protein